MVVVLRLQADDDDQEEELTHKTSVVIITRERESEVEVCGGIIAEEFTD